MVRPFASCSLALTLLTIGGCGQSDSEYFGTTRPRHAPDVLWMNNGGEPQWTDPGKCADSNGGDVIWNTFAGLVEAHPATLAPMPDIASDWEISEDGTIYTFFLRESKWSDGKPLTAHDFEWSWQRLLDPATASKYAYIGYLLKNAEPFNARALLLTGIDPDTPVDDVQALVEQTVEVSKITASTSPPGYFLYVGGEDDEIKANRERAIAELPGKQLGESSLEARLVEADLIGVKAVDDSTLRVELENPVPYFLDLLSFYSFMPVPRHVIDQLVSEGKNPDLWTRPEYVVSNGAYKMTKWKFRRHMEFEKNEHYWNAAETRTPRVIANMVESYNTCLNLYKTGEIDFPGGNTSLPAEFMDHLMEQKDFRLDPYLGAYFYWFNTKKPPLDDIRVRQALTLSIDRESIVKHVTRAGQIPTATIVPDGLAGYRAPKSTLFDVERARQLLADAGYPDGKGMPPVTLIYNTSEGHKQIAVAVQQMWKDNLNVHINIENQEWKVYLKNLEMMDFQIARMGWIGDYPDPYTFLDLFLPTSGNNHSLWADEDYAQMLSEANRTLDKDKRLEMLSDAEAYMLKNQPVLPIYVYTRSQMIKPYIRGLWGNYQDRHQWKYMWIDERWYDGVPSSPANDEPPPPTPRVRPSGNRRVATAAP